MITIDNNNNNNGSIACFLDLLLLLPLGNNMGYLPCLYFYFIF